VSKKKLAPVIACIAISPRGHEEAPYRSARYATLRGAKSAISSRAGYGYRRDADYQGVWTFHVIRYALGGKPTVEVLHFELTLTQVSQYRNKVEWVPVKEVVISTDPADMPADCIRDEISEAFAAFDKETLTGPVADA
jgi:hypothetical protein